MLVTLVKGKMPAQWQAKWIDAEARHLRKKFTLSNTGRAFLYATARGIYDIWLNGVHLDGFLLAPGPTPIDQRRMVQCYSLSDLLRKGENEIFVSVGEGWHREDALPAPGDGIAFLAQLELEEASSDLPKDKQPPKSQNPTIVLVTDETWEAGKGPLGENDLLKGEYFDASSPFEATGPARVLDQDMEDLVPTNSPPVKEHERLSPLLLPGNVLDFGRHFAGYVELRLAFAKEGEKITFFHGDTLDKSSLFPADSFQNSCESKEAKVVTYITRHGKNVYKPTKCYFHFRYVYVEADFPLKAEMFTGIAIYSDIREIGFFSCRDERVNRLFENAKWNMKSNFIRNPAREKNGFTGDAQTFCETALSLLDAAPVFQSWLGDLAADSRKGVFRQMAPGENPPAYFENSHGWCDAIELIPWLIWKRTGDQSVIKENYASMKRWLDFAIERQQTCRPENKGRVPKALHPYFADQGFCWGEKMEKRENQKEAPAPEKGEAEVATAYLSYGCQAMSEMARALGYSEDSSYYSFVAERCKDAYREAFLPIDSDKQALYVRPVFMGLLTKEEKKKAVKDLASLIHQGDDHLNTGFLTTGEICRVLSDNGEASTAYDLLLQTDYPSWLYPVIQGATTFWNGEEEDPSKGNFDPYACGVIAGWLIDSVVGIRLEHGEIVLAPHPDRRLGWAEGQMESPLGLIVCRWSVKGDRVCIRGEVPVSAVLILPSGRKEAICGDFYVDVEYDAAVK